MTHNFDPLHHDTSLGACNSNHLDNLKNITKTKSGTCHFPTHEFTELNRAQLTPQHLTFMHLEDLASLYATLWCADLPSNLARLAGQQAILPYLKKSQYGICFTHQDMLLGAVLAGTQHATPDTSLFEQLNQQDLLTAFEARICSARKNLDPSQQELLTKALAVDNEELSVAHKVLTNTPHAYADAEIYLLMVSPAAQGLGLGGALFTAAEEALAHAGARGYFLMTDDECDVSFYEHKKLTRYQEIPFSKNINIYVYGKELTAP